MSYRIPTETCVSDSHDQLTPLVFVIVNQVQLQFSHIVKTTQLLIANSEK
jgi:hypothetical protein